MDVVLERICMRYGERHVLENFSHRFPEGCASLILGPSGCGKTTLLRLIAGLEQPDSGAITGVEGKKISAVFQEDRLFENLSAEKNVLLTAGTGFSRADARALLEELGLGADARRAVNRFSGGMRRRVAVARALAADYDLLLLDEPLSGLDEANRADVLACIRARAVGRTLICVSHDPEDATRLGAELLFMPGGSAR